MIQRKKRTTLLQFLIICLPLWLSAKFYAGLYHEEIQYYLAGILFIICCGLVVQMLLPRLPERPVLLTLFLIFCAIELVAWQYPGLFSGFTLSIDNRMVIGSHYSLNKIPYYGVGAFIAYFILRACRQS